ncbi:MAG: nuclear transport factor 2 family protein [Bacteroidota bacterium]
MTKKEICQQYIQLLEKGATAQLIDLFTENAIVDSPIYGLMPASKFYRNLASDTINSELKLLGIFEENDGDSIALYFNFKWTLKTNQLVDFDVVDIIKFDDQHKIIHLKIIYDTVVARGLVKQLAS